MKKYILGFILIGILASCNNSTQSNIAVICGITKDIKEIEIIFYPRPPEKNEEKHTIVIDSSFNFSLEVPITNLRFGFIRIAQERYDFCLQPGDNIHLRCDNDSIIFSGKGADKNDFLHKSRVNGLSNDSYYDELNNANILPVNFPKAVNNFKERQLDFLSNYSQKSKLSPLFVDYYTTLNQLNYELQVLMYPDYYMRRHKLNIDTLERPIEYYQLSSFSNIVNDDKLVSNQYINMLYELIGIKLKDSIPNISSVEDYANMGNQIIFDSLINKTQEYLLADWICTILEDEGYYDTLAIEYFTHLESDSLSNSAVKKAINAFNEKRNLINKSLPLELEQTTLLNSKNEEIMFGELLSSFKGKVVYLDVWASWCGPCKKEMPYSKQLREKLKSEAIEFVYISAEKSDSKQWKHLFELTSTKQNHFVYVKGFESKMLTFLQIQGVPTYLIFNKDGELKNYNAPKPSNPNIEAELMRYINE